MQPENKKQVCRKTYNCIVEGKEFVIVTFLGVITEASAIVKSLVGHDLEWFKQRIKGKDRKIVEVPKPIPLWLQDKDFEGTDINGGDFKGVLIIDDPLKEGKVPTKRDTRKLLNSIRKESGFSQSDFEREYLNTPVPKEETKLPKIPGIKWKT